MPRFVELTQVSVASPRAAPATATDRWPDREELSSDLDSFVTERLGAPSE